MLKSKHLLVTFPVDLGNRTLESNLHAIFSEDMDYYRFADKHADDGRVGNITLSDSLKYRFKSAFELRKLVREYSKTNKKIFFHGLSPALFAYGTWKPKDVVIAVDWTRNLYPSVLGEPLKKDIVFRLHKKVLSSCPKILCWTDAVMENLQVIYGINSSSLFKAPMPFYVDKLNIPPRVTPVKPRVLFVGGDLSRKGGDILLNCWDDMLRNKMSLTMMTNDNAANIEGVNFLPGVKYGSEIHKKTFEEHDILVLPTRIDGYPQVIGEAAAAGLAVITTKFALGAKEVIKDGISGFITDTPEECVDRLHSLLEAHNMIDSFKHESYNLMHQKFSKESIRKQYLDIMNS